MATRQTKTPGTPDAAKPVELKADTADQTVVIAADITPAAAPDAAKQSETDKEYAEFLNLRKNKDQSVVSTATAKRTRQVLTENGWTSEEY